MSMTDYVLKIKSYADSLSAAGHQIDDQDILLNVLNGLGNEYDSVVVYITSREDAITLSEAQYLLLTQEQRLEQQHSIASLEVSTASANMASTDRRSSGRGSNSGRGRGRGRGYGNQNRVVCQLCAKPAHMVNRCYKRFDHNFNGSNNQSPQGNNSYVQHQNSPPN
ncbi:hypothetical protein ACOSQ3_021869 [Xanthoceras sorbifolium]